MVQCSYCGATSQVKSGHTAAMQAPAAWQPPQTSTSAPSTAYAYRPPPAAPQTAGNAGCAVVVGAVVALAAVGAGVFFAFGGGPRAFSVDPNAAPTSGTVLLGAGPVASRSFPAVANGSIAARTLSPTCRGHFSSAPHLALRVTTVQRVVVTSRSNAGDLTLAVREPSGNWRCDDDGGEGTNPRLTLTLVPGVYPVWFGRYSSSATVPFEAVVESEELGSVPLDNGLAVASPPTLGSMVLAGPSMASSREGIAGGPLEASTLGSNCRGRIPAVPHLTLVTRDHRRVVLTTASNNDLTMVVRDASGALHCDDDGGESNQPRVETYAAPGVLQVWVGTFSGDARPPFTLSVQSEATNGVAPLPNGLSPMSPPTVTAIDIDRAGALTHLSGVAFGSLPARSVLPGCAGYLSPAPQLRMTSASRRRVTVAVGSHAPSSMVLRGPDGDMQCVDGRGTGGPSLTADFPVGATAVWVATPSPGMRPSFRLDVTVQGGAAAAAVK